MYAADARHANQSLEEKLQALYRLRGGPTIDLTIRPPYQELLAKLGNPQEKLPPVIHVAGTNGKGSVIAMLRSILEAAGKSVHVYTSPHLVRFNERIVLAGQEIEDGPLEALLDEVVATNDGAPLTFFEITTALALTTFARTPADFCLLETGLGGRLDCTNVVQKPVATVITRIGYDHTEFLGENITDIACEKAGIMKPGVPCILGPQESNDIEAVFEKRAREIGCPLIKADTHDVPVTNMAGLHQIDNAATARACIEALDNTDIGTENIKAGLRNVRWPARLQRISWPDMTGTSYELWVDGGHNESAGKALAAQAEKWQAEDGKKLCLVVGMMKTKDPLTFLGPIAEYVEQIICIAVPDEPMAYEPEELQKTLRSNLDVRTAHAANIQQAFDVIRRENSEARIVVTGSLYLASELLKQL